MPTTTTPLSTLQHVGGGHSRQTLPELRRVAQDFESVFLTQIVGELTAGQGTPGTTGGGADDPFAGMLREEYAKLISRGDGVGVADAVLRELIKAQGVS